MAERARHIFDGEAMAVPAPLPLHQFAILCPEPRRVEAYGLGFESQESIKCLGLEFGAD